MHDVIDGLWHRIEDWLELKAPSTFHSLNAPVAREHLAAAEGELGTCFSLDLQISLLRHDGAGGVEPGPEQFSIPAGYRLLPLASIIEVWNACAAQEPEFDPRWIPFAMSPERDLLVVDQSHGPHQGRVIAFFHSRLDPPVAVEGTSFTVASSFGEVLDLVAEGLESSSVVLDTVAAVDDGSLTWATEIETVACW
jgi:cell wall assembly regulator SMI1